MEFNKEFEIGTVVTIDSDLQQFLRFNPFELLARESYLSVEEVASLVSTLEQSAMDVSEDEGRS